MQTPRLCDEQAKATGLQKPTTLGIYLMAVIAAMQASEGAGNIDSAG